MDHQFNYRSEGTLDQETAEALKKTIRLLKAARPDLYAVFKAFQDHNCEPYYGFYADVAPRIGLTPNGVKYRLSRSLEWIATRMERMGDHG